MVLGGAQGTIHEKEEIEKLTGRGRDPEVTLEKKAEEEIKEKGRKPLNRDTSKQMVPREQWRRKRMLDRE